MAEKFRSGRHKKGGKNWWSDDERASIMAVLDSNGGDVAKTSRETGVPYFTIYTWKKGERCGEAYALRNEKKGDLANACEELAWLCASLIPRKVHDAPLNHLSSTFGVMVEKMKLLRGEYTTYGRTEIGPQNRIDLSILPPEERDAFLATVAKLLPAGPGNPTGEPSSRTTGSRVEGTPAPKPCGVLDEMFSGD